MAEKLTILGGSHAAAALCTALVAEKYTGEISIISADNRLPYHRPPLSKTFLKEVALEQNDAEPSYLTADLFYEKNAINLHLKTTISEIDRLNQRLIASNGATFDYDRLVIASGARARQLPMAGADSENTYVMRVLDDAIELGQNIEGAQSAVVIGGGFIGLETGATLKQLGLNVTVIEAADRLMGRAVAQEISDFSVQHLRELGLNILLSTPVDDIISKNGRVTGVQAGGKVHSADLLIVGIGAIPNTELAQSAGLACANGITVNGRLTTGDPNIMAIGDCASFPAASGDHIRLEAVSNANDQAKWLARHLAATTNGQPDDRDSFHAVPWFWSDQGDMKLQMAGLSQGADHKVLRGTPSIDGFTLFHFAGDHLMAVDTINRPGDHMFARKVLEQALPFTPELAADESIDLRQWLKEQSRPA